MLENIPPFKTQSILQTRLTTNLLVKEPLHVVFSMLFCIFLGGNSVCKTRDTTLWLASASLKREGSLHMKLRVKVSYMLY